MGIIVKNLWFSYDKKNYVLKNINLTIDKGETVCLIGHNGAGKSTLIKHFNGLLKPDKGDIWVNGWNTKEFSTEELSKKVGIAFQNPDDQIFLDNVEKEVSFGPTNLGFSSHKVKKMVEFALNITELSEYKNWHPYDLPYSKRRLLSIASILSMDTDIVILDEPTLWLDYKEKKIIKKIINILKKQRKTIIAISHDLIFCRENFSKVIIMKNGKIVYYNSF